MNEQRMVAVDSELGERLVVRRLVEDGGGFQRKLNKARIPGMAKALSNGGVCPPIIVAEIGTELIVIDGQHRLEAWKRKNFPLQAMIVKMESEIDAAKNFIDMNSNAKRVSLSHRLRVDPGEYAKNIRNLVSKTNVNVTQAHGVMLGILGHTRYYRSANDSPRPAWEMAATFLKAWSDDARWDKDFGIYRAVGVLRAVADIISRAKNPIAAIKKIKKIDFANSGALKSRCGSHLKAQKLMKEYIFRFLAENII